MDVHEDIEDPDELTDKQKEAHEVNIVNSTADQNKDTNADNIANQEDNYNLNSSQDSDNKLLQRVATMSVKDVEKKVNNNNVLNNNINKLTYKSKLFNKSMASEQQKIKNDFLSINDKVISPGASEYNTHNSKHDKHNIYYPTNNHNMLNQPTNTTQESKWLRLTEKEKQLSFTTPVLMENKCNFTQKNTIADYNPTAIQKNVLSLNGNKEQNSAQNISNNCNETKKDRLKKDSRNEKKRIANTIKRNNSLKDDTKESNMNIDTVNNNEVSITNNNSNEETYESIRKNHSIQSVNQRDIYDTNKFFNIKKNNDENNCSPNKYCSVINVNTASTNSMIPSTNRNSIFLHKNNNTLPPLPHEATSVQLNNKIQANESTLMNTSTDRKKIPSEPTLQHNMESDQAYDDHSLNNNCTFLHNQDSLMDIVVNTNPITTEIKMDTTKIQKTKKPPQNDNMEIDLQYEDQFTENNLYIHSPPPLIVNESTMIPITLPSTAQTLLLLPENVQNNGKGNVNSTDQTQNSPINPIHIPKQIPDNNTNITGIKLHDIDLQKQYEIDKSKSNSKIIQYDLRKYIAALPHIQNSIDISSNNKVTIFGFPPHFIKDTYANILSNSDIYQLNLPTISFFGRRQQFDILDLGMYLTTEMGPEYNKCLVLHIAEACAINPTELIKHWRTETKQHLRENINDITKEIFSDLMTQNKTLIPDILSHITWLPEMRPYCFTFITGPTNRPSGSTYFLHQAAQAVNGYKHLRQVFLRLENGHYVLLKPSSVHSYNIFFKECVGCGSVFDTIACGLPSSPYAHILYDNKTQSVASQNSNTVHQLIAPTHPPTKEIIPSPQCEINNISNSEQNSHSINKNVTQNNTPNKDININNSINHPLNNGAGKDNARNNINEDSYNTPINNKNNNNYIHSQHNSTENKSDRQTNINDSYTEDNDSDNESENDHKNNCQTKKDNSNNFHMSWKYPINKANLPPGFNSATKLIELPWEYMYLLPALGTVLQSLPRTTVALVRTVLAKYQTNFINAAQNEDISLDQKDLTYKKFALLPTVLFIDRTGTSTSRADIINTICVHLLANDWNTITVDSFPGKIKTPNIKTKYSSQDDEIRRRDSKVRQHNAVVKFMRLGELSKSFARAAQISEPSKPSEFIRQKLQQLHPKRQQEISQQETTSEYKFQYTLEQAGVKTALSNTSKGTAAGQDNLAMDVIRQVAYTMKGRDYLNETALYTSSLTMVMDHIFNDKRIPIQVVTFFTGGILLPIQKPGSEKIRPICMGASYPKLIEAASLAKISNALKKEFKDVQYGVGHKGGQDYIIHHARFTKQFYPTLSSSQSDFENAYNRVSRKKVLSEVVKKFPSLQTMSERNLIPTRNLTYIGLETGVHTISAEEGVPQGAVSSGAFFSLAILDLCKTLQNISSNEAPQGGTTFAYLDDIDSITTVKGIHDGLDIILQATDIGIALQLQKQTITLGIQRSTLEAEQIKNTFIDRGIPSQQIHIHPANGGEKSLYGSLTMGIPIGDSEYIQMKIRDIIDSLIADFMVIQEYATTEPQTALLFLRLIMPGKLIYFLRGMTPETTKDIVDTYQTQQMNTLAKILDVPRNQLPLMTQEVALISLNEGGLGLTSAEDIADAAYVASVTASLEELMICHPSIRPMLLKDHNTENMPDCIKSYLKAIERLHLTDSNLSIQNILNIDPANRNNLQKTFSRSRKQHRLNKFRKNLSDSDQPEDVCNLAMHHSCGGSMAAGYLYAIPKTKNLSMSAKLFRRSVLTRALVPDFEHTTDIPCKCKVKGGTHGIIDKFDYHYLKCNLNNGLTIITHSAVLQTIQTALSLTVGTTVTAEPSRYFSASDPTNQQRLDLAFRPKDGGDTCGYDVTITHPVTSRMTNANARKIGRAADIAEKRKISKYKNICETNGINFVPIVYEAGGRPGELWLKEIQRLFKMHDQGEHRSFQQYWNMRISIALQTGIANAILIRQATHKDSLRKRKQGGIVHDDIDFILDSTYLKTGGTAPNRNS